MQADDVKRLIARAAVGRLLAQEVFVKDMRAPRAKAYQLVAHGGDVSCGPLLIVSKRRG
jgi:hypothetical protein